MKNSPVLLQESSCARLRDVRLVASDMDGTLTQQGQFAPTLLQALAQLAALDVATLIVTGRSAGWVQGVAHYLPVAGAIAENGGVFIAPETGELTPLVELPDPTQHRQHLAAMFAQLQTTLPTLQPATDNPFRLTDWTFDVRGLTAQDLSAIADQCRSAGWGFTYSTVQCHIRPAQQDKGAGLRRVWQRHFADLTATQIVTVGDSPNDADLFDADQFPLSVGVANVQHYRDRLPQLPTFITPSPEVQGFQELVAAIAQARSSPASPTLHIPDPE